MRGYGGYTWTPESSEDETRKDHLLTGLMLTAGGAVGTGAVGMALIQSRNDYSRFMDDVIRGVRAAANLTPLQFGHTFSAPEFLSVAASPVYQGFEQQGDIWVQKIAGTQLRSSSTYAYIKALTGLETDELAARGIVPGMVGDEAELASEIILERGTKGVSGKLYSQVGQTRHLLSNNVMFMEFTREASDFASFYDQTGKVNRGAQSIFQALDLWNENPNFDPGEVFSLRTNKDVLRPNVIPIPGFGADFKGTAAVRAIPAFEMERFNRLLGGWVKQTFGESSTTFMKRMFGFSPKINPGTASSMFMRFGIKTAAVAGIGLAIGEADWARRQLGTVGHLGVSGLMSAGVAGLAFKAGMSSKASLFAGTAAFFGQVLLPGFNQGIWPGIVNTYASVTMVRAHEANPVNYYRRTLEGFAPGISSWQTGALAGLGAVWLGYGANPFTGKLFTQTLAEQIGPRLGITGPVQKTIRQRFWQSMAAEMGDPREFVSSGRRAMYVIQSLSKRGFSSTMKSMTDLWSKAEKLNIEESKTNPLAEQLVDRLRDIEKQFQGKSDWVSTISKHAQGLAEQAKFGLFGVDLQNKELMQKVGKLGFKSPLGRAGMLFFGVLGFQQVATGGLFGSMETREELQDIYSGREFIAVKKSRWWESGGTPFSGDQTLQYRPHYVATTLNRVREKGIWGEREDERSPITKFFLKNFTYTLERESYYDRPYPITSAAFQDVPIIGKLLSASIGQLIKPRRLMHVEEWLRLGESGGLEYADVYEGWRREPAYELGYQGIAPTSPGTLPNIASDMMYQFNELAGLTGFVRNTASKLLFSSEVPIGSYNQLADSGYMTSAGRRFWESNVGGFFFQSETIRRVFPRYRSEISKSNPILNNMPTWMPDRFKYGDPYMIVPWGEAILPGAGYEALRPELQGIDPEDYPDIYKYEILSSVSPYSRDLLQLRERIYQQRAAGAFSPQQERMIDSIDERLRDRWNIYSAERVHPNAITLPGSGLVREGFYTAQQFVRDAAAPAEYLMPFGFRPIQKLMGETRDPISQYEYERLYGTQFAFWDKPVRDWFRPSFYSAMHFMGYQGKPQWRKEADNIGAYFDKLEFYKWMKLAEQARSEGRYRDAHQFMYAASSTRMGVDPQGDVLGIYWSLPAEERKFFNAFAMAQGRDRARIKAMIPEDQLHLYQAIWSRLDQGDESLWPGEGGKVSQEYLEQQYKSMYLYPMPPEDWIGYNQNVDISDIKVKYVNELGKNLHDYGLWESQLRQSMAQEEILAGSTDYMINANPKPGDVGMRAEIARNLNMFGGMPGNMPNIFVFPSNLTNSSYSLYYNDDRHYEVQGHMQDYIGY